MGTAVVERPSKKKYVQAALTHLAMTLEKRKQSWRDDRAAWAAAEEKKAVKDSRVRTLLRAFKRVGFKQARVRMNSDRKLELVPTANGFHNLTLYSVKNPRFHHSFPPNYTLKGIRLQNKTDLREMVGQEYDRQVLQAQLDHKKFDMPLVHFIGLFTDIKEEVQS